MNSKKKQLRRSKPPQDDSGLWGRLSSPWPATALVVLGVGLLYGLFAGGRSAVAESLVPLHSVRGQVLCDGRPLADAIVVLHPVHNAGPSFPRPNARTGPDGSFTIGTYVKEDGAPVGEYRVTVVQLEKLTASDDRHPRHLLPSRYARPDTSGLRAQVSDGDNSLAPLRISRLQASRRWSGAE